MFSLTTCLLAGGRLGVRPPGAAGGTTQYPRDGSSLAVACARNLDKKNYSVSHIPCPVSCHSLRPSCKNYYTSCFFNSNYLALYLMLFLIRTKQE